MKKYQKNLLIAAIVVIVVGTFLAIVGAVTSAGEIGNFIDRRWERNLTIGLDDEDDVMQDVESLELEVTYGEVRIVTGNEFRVRGANVSKNSVSSYMDGDKWIIRYNYRGFRGWPIIGWFNWQTTPKFEITIPNDFIANELSLSLGAGELKADAIVGDRISIELGAGSCRVYQVIARESLSVDVGAGSMEINGMDVKDLNMSCGAGRIFAEGRITGNGDVDCGVGEITLDLIANPDLYHFTVDCALGQVRINGDYYNFSTSINHNKMADYTFNVNCGIGKVNLDMNER
jgi:hypothetical protein